jgi:hypothetical protein
VQPLDYHSGQRAVQDEAQTRAVADKLADWVGPAREFCAGADLFLMAMRGDDGALRFVNRCGPPPLVEPIGDGALRLAGVVAPAAPTSCGGLAIHLAQARRARVNGTLRAGDGGALLEIVELFTLCRKYMAPSLDDGGAQVLGPTSRTSIALDDPWIADVVARAETSFLATVAPSAMPDVAHRGGPPGFLVLDVAARLLRWPEYVGDGIFKSAGNVRATEEMTLLVIDLDTGDGVELHGRGGYENRRAGKAPRTDALVKHKDPYPVQGEMTCRLEGAMRLTGAIPRRRRIERALKITSSSEVGEQKPQ